MGINSIGRCHDRESCEGNKIARLRKTGVRISVGHGRGVGY